MPLSINVSTVLETSIVILSGRLSALDRLGGRIEGVLKTASLVMIDLTNLRYVDAHGIGELITVHETVRRGGGRLVLFRPDCRLKALLKIANLTGVFEVDDGVRRCAVTSESGHDSHNGLRR